MVDKKVGTAGTLRITDDGTTVRFYVLCSDPATNTGGYPWRIRVNGTWTAWQSTSLSAGFGSRLLASRTVTTSHTVRLEQGNTGTMGLGGSAYVDLAVSRAKPKTPTGLSVTRVSDKQHTLNWTRASTYTSVLVDRRTEGGSGSWQRIAAPTGNVSTYTDKTTIANRKYEYRVAGVGEGGTSAWSNIATVFTTPGAPRNLVAKRVGNNIEVNTRNVEDLNAWADFQRVYDNGVLVGDNVHLADTVPFVHVGVDPLITHTYTVRNVKSGLVSALSAPSNTVNLMGPPNPPNKLTPNGGVWASDTVVKFQWTHSPVDTSAQSAFELRYRVDGGAWTTITGTTATSVTVSLEAAAVEWQVRTKGIHPDWSPFSAIATVSVVDRPGVSISSPGLEWTTALLTVAWDWFQAQGRPQSAWRLELLDDSLSVIERGEGTGATTSFIPKTRLKQGAYTVRVQAATGNIWSDWSETTFDAVFVPPAPPMIYAEWNEQTGGVGIRASAGGMPGPADLDMLLNGGRMILWDQMPDANSIEIVGTDAPTTVQLIIERFQDGAWETIDGTELWWLGPGGGAAFNGTDYRSASWGDIPYRVTAVTADGATASTEIIVAARSESIWLSGGPGFSRTCRLPLNPSVDHSTGRSRALKQFAGRRSPVAVSGEAVTRSVAVSGRVTDRRWADDTATPNELAELAEAVEALHLFRDPDGRRIFGAIGDVRMPRETAVRDGDGWNGLWGYSFTLTEATAN